MNSLADYLFLKVLVAVVQVVVAKPPLVLHVDVMVELVGLGFLQLLKHNSHSQRSSPRQRGRATRRSEGAAHQRLTLAVLQPAAHVQSRLAQLVLCSHTSDENITDMSKPPAGERTEGVSIRERRSFWYVI